MLALRYNPSPLRFAALKVLGRLGSRAFYEGPLATVSLDEVPEPAPPRPGWVKIKTGMCGFCGSDLNMILLKDSPTVTPFVSFPAIMGHEFFGEVAEVGEGVKKVAPGDRVAVAPHLNCPTREVEPPCEACRAGRPGNCENFARGALSPGLINGLCRDAGGGFAPLCVVHESQVYVLPDSLPDLAAVVIEPFAIALQAVADNRPRKSDDVLVVGGGVIGSLVVHAIRALGIGCRVTVVEPSPVAAEYAARAGADEVARDGDIPAAAVRVCGARSYKPMIGANVLMGGFDKVFDTVGNSATVNACLRSMAMGGAISVIGVGHDVTLDLTPLWLKVLTIKGVYAYGNIRHQGKRRHAFSLAVDLAQKAPSFLASMVTHRFALKDYKSMIRTNLEKAKHTAMKTVVVF
ncbi:MAG: alcohol dehydrogenase catalytic domain-containing protein [Deltaproteobacteria bacterium]|nr:alcohol dehydrogenase catalytic domain-containing protein [Deltaproteobacteria bacterium]